MIHKLMVFHFMSIIFFYNFRHMLFTDLSRQIFPDRIVNRAVYDLDELTKNTPPITPNASSVNLLSSSSSSSSSNRIVPVLRKSQSAPKLSLLRGASFGYVWIYLFSISFISPTYSLTYDILIMSTTCRIVL